jgi:ELWxxDGT repeat protein
MSESHLLRFAVGLVASLCVAAATPAQQTAIPYVVRDLFVLPANAPGNSQPGPLTTFNGYGYFAATSLVNGRELWRTDGTSAGTILVRDINPGLNGSSPADFIVCNGVLYFTADDGTHGREVWRTDGTALGTRMIADINPGPPSSAPQSFAVAGGNLLFAASPGTGDAGMSYVCNGSALSALRPTGACCLQSGACIETTSIACSSQVGSMWGGLQTLCVSTACNQPVALSCCMPDKSCVYTTSASCTAAGGTPGGPNVACGSCPDPPLFTCCTGTTCSVGTLSSCTGTFLFLITSCSPDPCPQPQSACCLPSGQCFMVRFAADCSSRSGTLLATGTTCISTTYDLNCTQPTFACCRTTGVCSIVTPSNCRSSRGFVQPLGVSCAPGLCFVPNTTDLSPSNGWPIQFENQVAIFATGAGLAQLWLSDGTPGGTVRLANLPQEITIPTSDSVAGGRLYFSCSTAVGQPRAVWSTDGTASGTGPAPALAGQTTYSPAASSGGLLYYFALDGASVNQLWRTDGTPAGTMALTSFTNPSGQPGDVAGFNGGIMFTAVGTDTHRRWWFSDGTPAGTHLVGPIGSSIYAQSPNSWHAVLGNTFLFTRGSGGAVGAGDLWATDGTTAGTRGVFPIPVEEQAQHPGDLRDWTGLGATTFSVFNGRAYFMGTDYTDFAHPETNTLWSTDGTLNGTGIVSHIQGGNDSSLSEMAAGANNDLFFASQSVSQGIELFKTSGTAGSTAMVKDISPGASGSFPTKLTYNNGVLLFDAYDTSAHTTAYLYRSDGTAAGTYPLGSSATYCCGGSTAARPVVLGNQLIYFEATPQTGVELWHSDGTSAGTGLVAEAIPGSADGIYAGSPQPVVYNGSIYYAALNGFYKSNGTAAGTVRLMTVASGTAAATWIQSTPIGVFFAGPSNALWISDGSVAGTHVLSATAPQFDTSTFVYASGLVFFTGYNSATGWEVWVTDGTAAGTRLVVDLTPGNAAGVNGPRPTSLAAFGNNVYYILPGAGGLPVGWYVTDGTAAGTRSLFTPTEFPYTISNFWPGNGVLLIGAHNAAGRQDLWSYAGTVASLINLTVNDSHAYTSYPFEFPTPAGPYTYFFRRGNSFGGLYRTDGTAGGTVPVLTLNVNFYNNTGLDASITPFGNDVILSTIASPAATPTPGERVYRTNAPGADLQTLMDLSPFSTNAHVVAGTNSIYFSGSTATTGPQVYVSDGTPAGTHMITPIDTAVPLVSAGNIRKAGSLFYFQPGTDPSLYRSDGTLAGSWLVDVYPTTTSEHFSMSGSADLGGLLYYSGYRPAVGAELWRSDGTTAGTQMVVDALPGASSGVRGNLTTIGNSIFFSTTTDSQGEQPWTSDGTAAGTHRLTVLTPGTDALISKATDLNGLAIFTAANYRVNNINIGEEIFRSDGTAAGTYLLRDILSGINASYPRGLTAAGNYVFFSADDGVHGRELWRTDGTVAGTVMVRDICFGDVGSNPDWITAAGDRVYFTAYTPETGVELWTSDGTAGGTFMLFEIVPGPSSANIRSLTRAGDRLYFLATVPPQQPSLWSFDWAGGLFGGFTCAADYNRSGALNVADVFDYLSDWFIGAYRADFNGSGGVNVQDIFDFLNSWFAGCH